MLATTSAYNSAISASVRKIKAKVELYNGSTLVATYTQADKVISFDIQRVGEDGKFFGFGICHRLNVHLIDIQRELDISTANTIKISLGAELPDGTTEYKIYPTFQVSEVHRDENTNELSVTAYDAIYKASENTVSELVLTKPYTIKQFVEACASVLGISVSGHTGFTLSYENGANFDGTETIREALDDVAEATQTIYYLDFNNTLCFKQLDKSGDAILSIDKSKYITLKSGVGRRLQTICMATELGDNVSESTTLVGSTQYVRDNAFWELRTDINTLVHNAITAIGDISIDVFDCTWRGNPALEIGDKISLTTKDNQTLIAYLLNDTVKYDGSLSEQTQWKYDTNNTETASNPTSLGDVIKQTYARVDKQEKQITLLASDVSSQTEAIKKTVKQVDVEYYLSTSTSSATGGSWSTTAPEWEADKYMWSRQKVTYTDGTSITRNETCIAGAKGADGKDGVDGKDGTDGIAGKDGKNGKDGVSSYFFIRYSENENGNPMTTSPQTNTQYMGVATTTTNSAPTSYSDYTWSKIKGADGNNGTAGAAGADGKTSYLHIKYSDDGLTFTSNQGETIGKYIGTLVDFIESDSTTFSDYTWKKFVGEDGTDGKDGINGNDGADGRGITSVTTEYYISTSQETLADGSWSEEQPQWEEGKYIWTRSKIVYNNPTSTEYTTAVCDAAWAQINAITGQQKIITTDISQLKVEKNNISASVATIVEKQSDIDSTIVDMQQGIAEQNASNSAQFETLTNKVDATMTSEQVQLAISTEVAKGASKVTTSTGFTFDDNGLTISKSDSEMSTNINEDGMSIFRNSEEVLTADNTGVNATNLHATTYLIIGTNSRFEDYGSNRTGCFWIGS